MTHISCVALMGSSASWLGVVRSNGHWMVRRHRSMLHILLASSSAGWLSTAFFRIDLSDSCWPVLGYLLTGLQTLFCHCPVILLSWLFLFFWNIINSWRTSHKSATQFAQLVLLRGLLFYIAPVKTSKAALVSYEQHTRWISATSWPTPNIQAGFRTTLQI